MSDILVQLSQLFVQSIPTVVFLFLLLILLDRLFFRPVTAILKQREEATVGALARARDQGAMAEAKSREYEAAFRAARQESYRLREEERRAALSERDSALKKARERMEFQLKEAEATLRAQVETAKQELRGTSESLALELAEAVLVSGASTSVEGDAAR